MGGRERLTLYPLAAYGLATGLLRYFVKPVIVSAIERMSVNVPSQEELNEYIGSIAAQESDHAGL